MRRKSLDKHREQGGRRISVQAPFPLQWQSTEVIKSLVSVQKKVMPNIIANPSTTEMSKDECRENHTI